MRRTQYDRLSQQQLGFLLCFVYSFNNMMSVILLSPTADDDQHAKSQLSFEFDQHVRGIYALCCVFH